MLLEENIEAWKLWLLIQTQWRVGMSLIGLDYPAVIAVAKIYGIELTKELCSRIQALEFDVLLSQQKNNKS